RVEAEDVGRGGAGGEQARRPHEPADEVRDALADADRVQQSRRAGALGERVEPGLLDRPPRHPAGDRRRDEAADDDRDEQRGGRQEPADLLCEILEHHLFSSSLGSSVVGGGVSSEPAMLPVSTATDASRATALGGRTDSTAATWSI